MHGGAAEEKKARVEVVVENEDELQEEVQQFADRLGLFCNVSEEGVNLTRPELALEIFKICRDELINVFEVIIEVRSWKFSQTTRTFRVPVKVNLHPRLIELASTFAVKGNSQVPKDS